LVVYSERLNIGVSETLSQLYCGRAFQHPNALLSRQSPDLFFRALAPILRQHHQLDSTTLQSRPHRPHAYSHGSGSHT
jgi:hypothetical protein